MRELNRMPDGSAPSQDAFGLETRSAFAPLAGLRALDLTRSVAGGFCAKLLAELGAEVTRCVPPEEALPAEVRELSAPARAALEAWLHGDKRIGAPWRGTPRDLGTEARNADWIVEDWLPNERAALGWDAQLAALAHQPIDVSVTDYGLDPAWQGPPPDEARRLAETGHAWYGTGGMSLGGRAGGPPGWIASVFGGLYAAAGALLAWHTRSRGVRVPHVEHAVLEGLAGLRQNAVERWHLDRSINAPDPARWLFACQDGFVAAPVSTVTPPELLAALTCDPAFSADDARADSAFPGERAEEHRQRLACWFARQTRNEAGARAQMLQQPFGRVRPLPEILAEPHFAERQFWRSCPIAGVGEAVMPRLPFRYRSAASFARSKPVPEQDRTTAGQREHTLPLFGLRVLESGSAWAGPLVGRLLAEFGAEVVRIEPARAGDPAEPGDAWIERAAQHRGKSVLALDLSGESGRDTLRRLSERADVLLENFRPGVTEAWGCGYEHLVARNPALIGLSLSGFGRGGPLSERRAFGATIEAEAGWAALAAGAAGAARLSAEPLCDPLAALHGFVALLAALRERERTGLGGHLDLSQAECALHAIGDLLALASAGLATANAGRENAWPTPRTIAELCEWPYLHARGAFMRVPDAQGPVLTHLRTPLNIEGLRSRRTPASPPGADPEHVLRSWLSDRGKGAATGAPAVRDQPRGGATVTR